MAASKLTFKGKNSTDQGWHFALYQKYPDQPGLKSVAWKQLILSKPQSGATHGSFSWDLKYQVTIASKSSGDIYVGGVTLNAREGYSYEAVMVGGYVQISEGGQTNPGYITFKNATSTIQNLGLNIDGDLVALQEKVAGGVTAHFQITPTYYLSLFSNIIMGSLVSSDQGIGPVEIKFPEGKNIAEVDAVNENGRDQLTDPPTYSYAEPSI